MRTLLTLGCLLAVGGATAAATAAHGPVRKPNVVVILTDDG